MHIKTLLNYVTNYKGFGEIGSSPLLTFMGAWYKNTMSKFLRIEYPGA